MRFSNRTRDLICLIASLLLGLNFLVAGVGKFLGQGEFFGALEVQLMFLPPVLITLLSWTVPILEVIIGGALVLGILRRLMAALTLPLISGFIFTNVRMLAQGLKFFECPHCYGEIEELFGTITVMQAFIIDLVMVLLALVIIFSFRGGFFTSQLWFAKAK